MELGLHLIRFDWPGSPRNTGTRLADIGRTADGVGIAQITVMDHYFQIGIAGPPEADMLEGYVAATHLAAHTEHTRLGVLATGVHYRHPGLLVKIVTSLDVLSGGRAVFPVGAGWNEPESVGLGVPFPSLAERFEWLEDTLRLAHQMWRDDDSPFHGTHVHAERPINHPLPLTRPHPPIMVSGGGEKKTLRLVAQYGDACNLFTDPAQPDPVMQVAPVVAKLDVLRTRCDEVGRDYDEITKTATASWRFGAGAMSTSDALAICKAAHDAGISMLTVMLAEPHDLRNVETMGEVAREIATWT